MLRARWPAALLLPCLLVSACALAQDKRPPEDSSAVISTDLQSMIQTALADAAKRTQFEPSLLKVTSAERVTWSDGSLGCPRKGMLYTQALVPGYRIRIQAGADSLDYHAGLRGGPVLCPASRATEPVADPRT